MQNRKVAVVLVGKYTGQIGVIVNEHFEEIPHVDLFLPNIEPVSADDSCVFKFHQFEIAFIEETFNVDLIKGQILFHQNIN